MCSFSRQLNRDELVRGIPWSSTTSRSSRSIVLSLLQNVVGIVAVFIVCSLQVAVRDLVAAGERDRKVRLHVLLNRHVGAAGEHVTPELQEQVKSFRMKFGLRDAGAAECKAKTKTYQAQIAAAAAQLLSGSAFCAGSENVDIQDLEFQLLQYLRYSDTPKSDEANI